MQGRNDYFISVVRPDGCHFKGREFENGDGWIMVHSSVLVSLENVWEWLTDSLGEEVEIIVGKNNSTRTQNRQEELGARLGWTDEGGLVSRDSRHRELYGGCAVDIKARVKQGKTAIPQHTLGRVCRLYFDFVKDDYDDGHVHADNRNKIG